MTRKIELHMEAGLRRFDVRSVELAFRDGVDYLSFVVSDDLGEDMLIGAKGRVVEPVCDGNAEKPPEVERKP